MAETRKLDMEECYQSLQIIRDDRNKLWAWKAKKFDMIAVC